MLNLPTDFTGRRRRGLPSPSLGPDPWCVWCHEDLSREIEDGEVWMIEGRDEGKWPAAFCSLECAEAWGCAAHEGKAYRTEVEL